MIYEITVNSKKVFYEETGTIGKPYLVLLHPLFSSHLVYNKVCEILHDDFHIIAPDIPGFGDSERLDINNITSYTCWLRDFVNFMKIQHFVIWGSSMGGSIALSYAAAFPTKIDAVISESSPVCSEVITPLDLNFLNYAAKTFERFNLVEKDSSWKKNSIMRKMLVRGYSLMGHDKALACRLIEKPIIDKWIDSIDVYAIRDIVNCFRNFNIVNELKSIISPTLVISSRDDSSVLIRSAEYICSSVTNSDLKVLSKGGHVPSIFYPEMVCGFVEMFINKSFNLSLNFSQKKSLPVSTEVSIAE